MSEQNSFVKGIKDGLPICFGYLSVAFAFGIFAVSNGFSIFEAVIISMTNVTSAGQLAGVPIIAAGGTLFELALSQFIINLRYALMSVSLSQKLGKTVSFADRFIIAFVNTDEVFAVSSSQKGNVGRNYMFGLILTPFLGWSMGTLLGAVAGDVLPSVVTASLGIAIYAMFVAIVIPPSKKCKATALCASFAILIGCIFRYTPFLKVVPSGFVIIIAAGVASAVFAILFPREVEQNA